MEDRSVRYCKRMFGHYGTFSMLRLHTAVSRHDRYSLGGFDYCFGLSGKDHEDDPGMREFMNNLDYADAEHFNTQEMRFLLAISTSYKRLTDEQIEDEREEIQRNAESGRILSTHAQYLLKAVDYWKMYFKDKFEEWKQEFSEADKGWVRRKLAASDLAQTHSERRVKDDGYFSVDDGEEDDSDDEFERFLLDRELLMD
jgi:hypothetical protein